MFCSLQDLQNELLTRQSKVNISDWAGQFWTDSLRVPFYFKGNSPESTTSAKRPGRKPLEKTPIVRHEINLGENVLIGLNETLCFQDVSTDPKQKRKAQNRAAQRAFRERKEKFVAELQERIRQLEQENSTKNESLIKENEALKEKIRKLEAENYALKGAQFTFEFPYMGTRVQHSITANEHNSVDDASRDSSNTTQNTSGQSFQSGANDNNSNNDDRLSSGSSSREHSPQSSNSGHEEPLPFTTTTPTDLFAPTDTNFTSNYIPNPPDFDFLAVPSQPGQDLFDNNKGTTALFSSSNYNYRVPTIDDFLQNDTLPQLFGTDSDLFGLTAPAPFSADQEPVSVDPSSFSVDNCDNKQVQPALQTLQNAKGRLAYDVTKELQATCPDFDLDALCEDLKAKATCSMSKHVVTEHDVQNFMQCFNTR